MCIYYVLSSEALSCHSRKVHKNNNDPCYYLPNLGIKTKHNAKNDLLSHAESL